jgi:hypothetical protein
MKKKPFNCNICDSSFTKKGQMRRHVASSAVFALLDLQEKHLNAHLEQLIKNLILCNICYASFTSIARFVM